jgi:cytidylate kinase
MHPIRHEEVVRLVRERPPACGATRVVAVDGRSGAGKTRFAGLVADALDAPVLHLEDLYPGWRGLAATPPAVVRDVLEPLASGTPGRTSRWDWARDVPGDELVVPPSPVLVLEGVGSGAAVIRPFLTVLVWLEAPADVRRHRALTRDGDVFAPFWDVWADQEAAHLADDRTPAHADLVLDATADAP